MAEYKNIFRENNEQISDEDLLKYLDENISKEEKYAIEKKLADTSPFENDAIEGLQQLKSPELVKNHVNQLNQKLQQQLHNKKHRKQKVKFKDLEWIILAILIILFVCIIAYTMITLKF